MDTNRINERLKQPPRSDIKEKRDLTKILNKQFEHQDSSKLGAAAEGLGSPISSELAETSLDGKIDKIVENFNESRKAFEELMQKSNEACKNIEGIKPDFSKEDQQELTVMLNAEYEFLKENKSEFEKMGSDFKEVALRLQEIKQADSKEIKARFFENSKEKEQIEAIRGNQQESRLRSPASPEFARDAWNKMRATIKAIREDPVPLTKNDIDEQHQDLKDGLKDIPTNMKDMFNGKTCWVDDAASSNFEYAEELQKSLKGTLNSSRQLLEDSKKLLEDYSAFSQRYNSTSQEPPRPLTLKDFWF